MHAAQAAPRLGLKRSLAEIVANNIRFSLEVPNEAEAVDVNVNLYIDIYLFVI